jgi:hypothetical protein
MGFVALVVMKYQHFTWRLIAVLVPPLKWVPINDGEHLLQSFTPQLHVRNRRRDGGDIFGTA